MASLRDLSNVLFNPLSKFEVGETVLVARSSGGFTYGELIADMPVLCMAPLEREGRHRVKGWRIALDEKKSMKKELPTVLIGKIPLCGAISEIIPPAYEPISAPPKKKRSRKPHGPRKGRGKRSRHPDRTSNLTPAAPIGVLNPAEQEEAEESEEDEFDEEEEEDEEEYDEEDEEEDEEEEEDEDSEIILFRPPGADQESAVESSPDEDSDSEEILVQARPGNGGILQIPGTPVLLGHTVSESPKTKPLVASPQPPVAARIIPPAASQAPVRRPPGSGKLTVPVNSGLKCLVVIDAPNVAMKHGNRNFSTKGIMLCVQYYKQRGHEVVAFLPEHYVNGKKTPGVNGVTISDYYNPKVDDMNIINQLVRDEILFFTPPQDYDDSYCIEYAKQNGGIIVTNDMYRDHINQFNEPQRGRVKRWIREHVCSFTFVKDTFLPNPDFKLP